jgi:hypothetical protein
MQPLFDLAPLLAFLVAYYLGGIYVATAVLMVAMVALLLVDLLRREARTADASAECAAGAGTRQCDADPARSAVSEMEADVFLWADRTRQSAQHLGGSAPLAQRLLAPMISGSETLPRRCGCKLNLDLGRVLRVARLPESVGGRQRQRTHLGQLQGIWPERGVRSCSRSLQALWLCRAHRDCRRLKPTCPWQTPSPTAVHIESLLQQRLQPAHLEVRDDSRACRPCQCRRQRALSGCGSCPHASKV